ncbi:hypothetical protein [Bailinhaonella thermotolerans]|uniref:Uncharacterized protein n=1 Tax=Bailinhaonella thermotolerans TaxID=1070861 RepID=A0A3A4AUD7_9ACTN|nr:hypothetical protein [Bailinhaonella thermotolerans]RJL30934.1 hypothetical protein D5H75_21830 [Bailinhaonella thermotolerans]
MNDRELLDGRRFVIVNTADGESAPENATEFLTREAGGVVWGTYRGGEVTHGRFVGTRVEREVELSYAHRLADGELAAGHSRTRIELLPDGRLRLVGESGETEESPAAGPDGEPGEDAAEGAGEAPEGGSEPEKSLVGVVEEVR